MGAEMYDEENLNLAAVAEEAGFSDKSHFGKEIRRGTGVCLRDSTNSSGAMKHSGYMECSACQASASFGLSASCRGSNWLLSTIPACRAADVSFS